MDLQFYNSLSRRKEKFIPLNPGQAGLYTCGPTVYNYPHIGNYRAYIFEDILRRTLKYFGLRVNQVMNLTDVDDKTIRDAAKEGLPLNQFTQRYKDAFFADLKTLRIEPAEHYPAATEHIPEMIDLVRKLLERKVAYQTEDGSVYFSISRYPKYGCLVNLDPQQLRSSGRVNHDEYDKESVSDFALWKAREPEDGDVWWDSPWGPGRPGWHLECSAMSMKYLGESFDIHTGGVDNMFPHHEDEIAQSEAATGRQFVRYWLHCAHLIVEGKKMSKSLGNFFTLRDLLDKNFSGRELRYVLLGTHYRQPLNFTFQGCRDAKAALERIDDFTERLRRCQDKSLEDNNQQFKSVIERAESDFRSALADDLNTAEALAALFNMIRDVNRLLDQNNISSQQSNKLLHLLSQFDSVLGVIEPDKKEPVPPEIERMARERQEARKQKDFARADSLRDQLTELGWMVEDTPEGPKLKRLV